MNHQHITTYRHESPLGSWRISLCPPDPRLAGLVASIWYGEGSVSYERDRILPSGQSQRLIKAEAQRPISSRQRSKREMVGGGRIASEYRRPSRHLHLRKELACSN